MGYREVISHLQSSYGLICYPEAGFDFARPGIALYGVLSSPDQKLKKKLGLKPVLSLRARVAAVKELRPGDTAVSYTHLDVYKRQVCFLFHRILLIGTTNYLFILTHFRETSRGSFSACTLCRQGVYCVERRSRDPARSA